MVGGRAGLTAGRGGYGEPRVRDVVGEPGGAIVLTRPRGVVGGVVGVVSGGGGRESGADAGPVNVLDSGPVFENEPVLDSGLEPDSGPELENEPVPESEPGDENEPVPESELLLLEKEPEPDSGPESGGGGGTDAGPVNDIDSGIAGGGGIVGGRMRGVAGGGGIGVETGEGVCRRGRGVNGGDVGGGTGVRGG